MANLIPENVISEILAKADIESVVGRYVEFTKRTGSNYFGLCPFHTEKTPSFSINPQRGLYKCWGCGKGGNAIGFVMEKEGLSYPEAIRYLGEQYGVDVPEFSSGSNGEDSKNKKKRIYALLNETAKYYFKVFNSDAGKTGREYADKRQLKTETLRSFGIGFAPEGWDNLKKHLESKGYTTDEMKESGLFTVSKKTGDLIDLFRGRLMFPIFDAFGKIIAFGGRVTDSSTPKYVNSPDSYVYKKQDHLYGLNFSKDMIGKTHQMIVVEGYMDVISMHQAGVRNAVASLGTAFTDSQLRLAAKYAEEVVFFFDSDNAGQNAALRAIQMMLGYLKKNSGVHVRIKIAAVPDGKDPDEYIKANGAEMFSDVVRKAKDLDDYLSKRAYDDAFDDENGLDLYKYQEYIIQYGSWIYDDIKREKMASNAALYLKADHRSIMNRMNDLMEANAKKQLDADMREAKRNEKKAVEERVAEYKQIPISKEDDITEGTDYGQNVKNDIVYKQELDAFIYAVRLGASFADPEYIDREDIFRPGDFRSDSMKETVAFFLANFDDEEGISEPFLINELSRKTFNGMPAEQVYMNACDNLKTSSETRILADSYLALIYNIRLKNLDRMEKALLKIYSSKTPEERKEIDFRLQKIDQYREHIRQKGDRL